MIFTSGEFFVFLALVLAGLARCSAESPRRNLSLVASYVFYGWWDWRFCGLIAASTLLDYLVGIQIEEATKSATKRRWLALSLIANLGVLGYFKYANFFLESLRSLTGAQLPALAVVLPVGISFFTFQTMSYSIDVYRGQLRASRNLRDFALFVSFFPQLVAGPIVRAAEFLPQLADEHPLTRSNLVRGGELFLKGLIKKALFADTLAVYVDLVYAAPGDYSPLSVWLATCAYAGQIYYDFSGYSDMAIGVGRMLGYELPVNFAHPYLARSITDFWRRWHISLSTWLRDYLYITLGGNRGGPARTYLNLLVTMLLGGLWHGASWKFVLWGALHGGALALHKLWLTLRARTAPNAPGARGPVWEACSWALTLLFVVLCWVPFRAKSLGVAGEVLLKLAGFGPGGIAWFYVPALVVLVSAWLLHLAVWARQERELRFELGGPWGWLTLALVLTGLLLFAPLNTAPFVYFQF